MFGNCKGPIWSRDDFTTCFQREYVSPATFCSDSHSQILLSSYLESIFPLLVCVASLLYLASQIYAAINNAKRYDGYESLTEYGANGSFVPADQLQGDEDEDEETDVEDELDGGGYVALRRTRTHESVIEVNRPRGEFFLVVIEEAAVLAVLGVHVIGLLAASKGGEGIIASTSQVATWAYIAAIASTRLLLSSQSRLQFPKLWYHTAFIYCCLWCLSFLTFRSEIIHPRSKLSLNLTIADFSLITLLTVIALTSRKGNRPVKLEFEGDLEPSKEQTASVLSLATFGWVDAIVWKGYRQTFEITDVWNLAPRDKASRLLAEYRQVKRTSSLAVRLLGHFKRSLLIQAGWACISGFLTFAPTLLLIRQFWNMWRIPKQPQGTQRGSL